MLCNCCDYNYLFNYLQHGKVTMVNMGSGNYLVDMMDEKEGRERREIRREREYEDADERRDD